MSRTRELEKRTFYNGIEEGRKAAYEEDKKIEERKCGVKTYAKKREFGTFENQEVVVIPVGEIEVSPQLDRFVTDLILSEYGRDYRDWIQECYVERMKQILNDPTEFGKAVLKFKKTEHEIHMAHDMEEEEKD
jgi:hypothetical protein